MGKIITNLAATTSNRLPTQKEWKRINDASVVPDRGFTRQLKALDEEYEVVWDCVSNFWEIWKFPKELGRDPYMVLRVQTEGKTYKELSQDVLLKLTEFSWQRYTAKELAAYFDIMDEQVMRRRERDFRNKLEAISLDTFSWVKGILQVQVPQKFKIERMAKDETDS